MKIGEYKKMMSYLTRPSKNPTLVENMPIVKHDQIPPKSGPNSQGLNLNKKNSRKV